MQAIVLAAGKGTRMQSDLPKVLHQLAGEPLLLRPLRMLRGSGVTPVILVVGHGASQIEQVVRDAFPDPDGRAWLRFALQAEQRGTGHAVSCALGSLDEEGAVLIAAGDVPLLSGASVRALESAHRTTPAKLAFATFVPPDATGYGRVVRDAAGAVTAIREHRDCTDVELQITECNAGIYVVDTEVLRELLPRLGAANAQGEIYLTDLVSAAGAGVATVQLDADEVAGVNTPEQLAALEEQLASG